MAVKNVLSKSVHQGFFVLAFSIFTVIHQECSESTYSPPRTLPTATILDKQELYGDPGLVPSREGEHARRELALAGEITRSIQALNLASAISVQIQLPLASAEVSHGHALVIVTPKSSQQDTPSLEPQIVRVVQANLGTNWQQAQITILWAPLPQPISAPLSKEHSFLSLALSLIIFGASAGITLDRILRRRLSR